MLLRLCTYEGDVSIDNINICDIPLSTLRRSITAIPQDPFLFTGTVRKNLDPWGLYDDDAVGVVLRQCRFMETFPNGFFLGTSGISSSSGSGRDNTHSLSGDEVGLRGALDWMIEDSGKGLSQGQRQLLSLGRAMLSLLEPSVTTTSNGSESSNNHKRLNGPSKARIILIDEATTAVDDRCEAALVAAVSDLLSLTTTTTSTSNSTAASTTSPINSRPSAPVTVLMICHKLGGLRSLCTKELKLSGGKVVGYKDINKDGS